MRRPRCHPTRSWSWPPAWTRPGCRSCRSRCPSERCPPTRRPCGAARRTPGTRSAARRGTTARPPRAHHSSCRRTRRSACLVAILPPEVWHSQPESAIHGNALPTEGIPPYDGDVGVGGLLVLSYLLGTFPTALIVARLAGHDP